MKILLGTLMLILAGCSTFDSRVAEMRQQAQMCEGNIKFSVLRKGDDLEVMKYTCEWNDESI